MDAGQVADIRARDKQLREWLGKRNSYHPDELPAHIKPPTNAERSAAEVWEFIHDIPDKYFLYVRVTAGNGMRGIVTTWMGDKLGDCQLGTAYRDNFGGKRQSIRVQGINGHEYVGTYFKSSGDYARIRLARCRGIPVTWS
jgi:hypothetical protein